LNTIYTMNSRLYVALYSVTLLLSASLLFVVQPMFSKMILPLLGGTPQVWNTAMLFFQLLLLGGYAYAHGTTKYMHVKSQAILHLVLLGIFFFVLPIAIPEGWVPPVSKDPTWWQLSLMTITIGGPFFVLSGSAPMFQRWFAGTDHKDADNPYFLYGASNLGSMTALILYPVVIEPAMNLNQQSNSWMFGYAGLIALTFLCVLVVWKSNLRKKVKKITENREIISWSRRGKWLLLSFIPSSLMLGVTTYITTDVASVPLLWIIPLALYVGTFIIVFARKPIISPEKSSETFGFILVFILVFMMLYQPKGIIFVPFHLTLFFFAALVCHGALASSKPSASNLTEFYLIMSIGGALGGVFNALIVPNIFVIPVEYALVLGLATCMRFANQKQEKIKPYFVLLGLVVVVTVTSAIKAESIIIKGIMAFLALTVLGLILNKRWVFGVTVAITLLIAPPGDIWDYFTRDNIFQDRNFFGVMRVIDTDDNQRIFVHGTTVHGTQSLEKGYEHTPMSYYSRNSPIADMFEYAHTYFDKQKVAVLGLGVGVTACFDKKGRSFDFFEIDPGIIQIAQDPKYFTFLSGCGSPYNVIEGDARLTLARKSDESYDFILADAYSSDNIPVHLITREAIALYLQKLKPEGILGFNISNSYLDIEPVLAEIADSFGIKGYAKFSKGKLINGLEIKSNDTAAFAFALNEQQEAFFIQNGWTPAQKRKGVGLWTDTFSNIVGVIGTVTLQKRIDKEEEKSLIPKETSMN
jgi:spermidine synthase